MSEGHARTAALFHGPPSGPAAPRARAPPAMAFAALYFTDVEEREVRNHEIFAAVYAAGTRFRLFKNEGKRNIPTSLAPVARRAAVWRMGARAGAAGSQLHAQRPACAARAARAARWGAWRAAAPGLPFVRLGPCGFCCGGWTCGARRAIGGAGGRGGRRAVLMGHGRAA